ncbi:MAG: FAD-dependent oxidoreductase, partial [Chloroflexota bacterium]
MTHIHSDVLIIGGGQAGLATAHQLQATDLSFSILERHTTIGASWANRYDALTLFTPRAFSALPGMDMDGDPQGYATRDEFVAYLKAYAEPFEAFIHLDEDVQHLERSDDYFYARTSRGNTYSSDFVIIATGPFQTP